MSKLPFLKFYPSDWQTEPALRMCSLGARGLWIECLCIMHSAEPYGHLVINGRPLTPAQLASVVGAPVDQVTEYLAELEQTGAFTRTQKGEVISRRLIRDNRKRKDAVKSGKRGGNPTLRKQTEKSPTLKGGDKGAVKGRDKPPLKLRSQKSETSTSNEVVEKAFDEIWSSWSIQGRKRSKSKANCIEVLRRLSKSHDLKAIAGAAKRYASETDDQFHKALDRWLAGGQFENWIGGTTEPEPPTPPSEAVYRRAIGEWIANGEAGWPEAQLGPAPDRPGYRGPPIEPEPKLVLVRGAAS